MGKIAIRVALKTPFIVNCKKCEITLKILSLEGEVDDDKAEVIVGNIKWQPIHCPSCDDLLFEVITAEMKDDGKADDDKKPN